MARTIQLLGPTLLIVNFPMHLLRENLNRTRTVPATSGVLYPRAMAAILCFDFDDTILLENSTRLVFERFAAGEWRALEADYHAGKLTVEQFNIAAFDLIEATPEELAAAIVEDVHVRNGFLELSGEPASIAGARSLTG